MGLIANHNGVSIETAIYNSRNFMGLIANSSPYAIANIYNSRNFMGLIAWTKEQKEKMSSTIVEILWDL